MKSLIAACLCALTVLRAAQTNPPTLTSPDGAFEFRHSPELIHCTRGSSRPGAGFGWIQDSGLSQGDLCDDDPTFGNTIICLAYPKEKFKD
jgi:hypothetical protein